MTERRNYRSKTIRKDVEDEEEYLEMRGKALDEFKERAHRAIDEFEGSFVVIGLTFKKSDPTQILGNRTVVGVAGQVSDVFDLAEAVHKLSEDIILETAERLPADDRPEFLINLIKQVTKDKK